MITLRIDSAAKARGIETQKELREYILKKTGVELRPATISDFYRNNKGQINRNHLAVIMKALEITDFNEVLKINLNA